MKSGNCGLTAGENGASEAEHLLAESPWEWWRSQMPIADKWAYFDHAAVGPLSGPAAAAMRRFADEASELGDTVWPTWAARTEQLRDQAAN